MDRRVAPLESRESDHRLAMPHPPRPPRSGLPGGRTVPSGPARYLKGAPLVKMPSARYAAFTGWRVTSIAQGSKLSHEFVGMSLWVVAVDEVVRTEVGVRLDTIEDVEGGHQDRMPHGDGRPAAPAPSPQLVVLGRPVGDLGAGGRSGGLDERRPDPLRALAGLPGAMLAGRLVVARAHPGPGSQASRGAEPRHVHADLSDDGL